MSTDTTPLDRTDAAEAAVERFMAAWNATTDDDRSAGVSAAWTSDATVVDPLGDVRGHDAIAAFIAGASTQFPGHRFERTGPADAHHDRVRFGWRLVAPDGSPVVEGLEVGTLAADGRLSATIGFFGPLPTEAAAS